MVTLGNITKISEVTPEVTLFLRNLGFSNYYIIKIFDLVGEAAIGLTEDNPYWLLEEFHHMGFAKVDEAARKLGFAMDDQNRLEAAVSYGLRAYSGEGHTFAPLDEFCLKVAEFVEQDSRLVHDVLEDMAYSGSVQIANIDGVSAVYFYGYYKAECSVAGKLAALAEPECGLPFVAANPEALIRKWQDDNNKELSEEQKRAVISAVAGGVSIITGGPGTGKTTIINALISILEGSGLKVAVAAPTGRAAKRIMETSGHFACTVHRLLEYYYDEISCYMCFGRNAANPLDCNVVIVDEASMMDIMLTDALCDALKPGTRLILVGDADQLPSVGAGKVLADLIDSEFFYTNCLSHVYRQGEESGIVANAHRINKGSYPDYGGDFILIKGDKQQEILDKIASEAASWPLEKVQVLTPVKKGILGSINLNQTLQQVFNPPAEDKPQLELGSRIFRLGDRVMQIKNDYRIEYRQGSETGKGIFNGETGIIKGIDTQMRSVTVLYDENCWVEYPYVQLDEIELAYAVTVHKSQGSEYPAVIIPMTWFPPLLATRSLLYTAVTRAKEKVIIVGRPDYLNAMVDNNQSRSRNSGLRTRIETLYSFA